MKKTDASEICPYCKSTSGYEEKNGDLYCVSCGWEKRTADVHAVRKSQQENRPFARFYRILKRIFEKLLKLALIVAGIAIAVSLLGAVLDHFYGSKNQSLIECGYGNLSLRECYHPFWSWFSRDSLFIYDSGIIVHKKGQFKEETIEIPNSKIDRLQIKSGMLEKSVVIREVKFFSSPLKVGIRTKQDMEQVYNCLQFMSLPYTIEYER